MGKDVGCCGQFIRILFIFINIFFVVSQPVPLCSACAVMCASCFIVYSTLNYMFRPLGNRNCTLGNRNLSCCCGRELRVCYWERICINGTYIDCVWCSIRHHRRHWNNRRARTVVAGANDCKRIHMYSLNLHLTLNPRY